MIDHLQQISSGVSLCIGLALGYLLGRINRTQNESNDEPVSVPHDSRWDEEVKGFLGHMRTWKPDDLDKTWPLDSRPPKPVVDIDFNAMNPWNERRCVTRPHTLAKFADDIVYQTARSMDIPVTELRRSYGDTQN